MKILLAIILIFFLCFILYKASEVFVKSIRDISKNGLLSKFLLASLFGGIATSIPEVFVGITSAIEKKPVVALGNALGSNIVDLALVLPLAILLTRKAIKVGKENFSFKNAFLILTSSLLPFLLAIDGQISRIDGFFLVMMFIVYTIYVFQKRIMGKFGLFNFLRKLKKGFHQTDMIKAVSFLFISLLVLIFASALLIKTATYLSATLQIKMFLVSLFLIALGTSLPELFVAISAVNGTDDSILFGDIFGSLISNANLVVGISAMIFPITIANFAVYGVSISALFFVFFLFMIFSFTKHKFEKWEAVVMVSVYLLFFILESML